MHTAYRNAVSILSLSAALAASFAIPLILHLEHSRTYKPSCLLQTYLVVILLANTYHLRLIWILRREFGIFTLSLAQIAVLAILLIVESMHKKSFSIASQEKTSPEDFNGIFGERLFLWLVPLFRRGVSPKDIP
jgi:ATP-binding cassette, subfamily C (CFTR/MRP), member 1